MSAEASPRPWRVNDKPNGQLILYASIVECSDGRRVAFVCRSSDAALIVAAVNEHDRLAADEARYRTQNVVLRDLVRRLCDELESHYYEPQSMDDRSVVHEARVALGEDKP